MEKSIVLAALKNSILSVFPQLTEIEFNRPLQDLGANSVDRLEIIMLTLEKLELNIPLVKLTKANTIQELVTLISQEGIHN